MDHKNTNLSAVLRKAGDLVVENTEIPTPAENEVQLRMQAVGICGSDVHYWEHGQCGKFLLTSPMILGHEASGIVSAVGEKVTHLSVGDRVAIEPGIPCHLCSFCKEGRYNLCVDMKFNATPPVDGSLRQFYCHPADLCFKLPDHVSFEEGALLEPLSVAIHSCKRGSVGLGTKVLICGAGPIGLVSLLTAKAMGAEKVVITDIVESRLQVAKDLGADLTVLADIKDPNKMADKINNACNGWLPDVTIECSGAPTSLQTAVFATRPGGNIVTVGRGPRNVEVPIADASSREIDIKGVFRYVNCYPTALSMVANGLVDVKPLISHRFSLLESVKAFETAKTGAGGAIKVMIECGGS